MTKLGIRYYDPTLGRFTQPDPTGQDQHYRYAGNNPVNYTDPTGASHIEAAVGGVLGGGAAVLGCAIAGAATGGIGCVAAIAVGAGVGSGYGTLQGGGDYGDAAENALLAGSGSFLSSEDSKLHCPAGDSCVYSVTLR